MLLLRRLSLSPTPPLSPRPPPLLKARNLSGETRVSVPGMMLSGCHHTHDQEPLLISQQVVDLALSSTVGLCLGS